MRTMLTLWLLIIPAPTWAQAPGEVARPKEVEDADRFQIAVHTFNRGGSSVTSVRVRPGFGFFRVGPARGRPGSVRPVPSAGRLRPRARRGGWAPRIMPPSGFGKSA
jgi:hypothetical protein